MLYPPCYVHAQAMQNRNYLYANDIYLRLAIGNAPWPIGVTRCVPVRAHVRVHRTAAGLTRCPWRLGARVPVRAAPLLLRRASLQHCVIPMIWSKIIVFQYFPSPCSVGIHERKAREKISHVMNESGAGQAHIMNDEATRKFLQVRGGGAGGAAGRGGAGKARLGVWRCRARGCGPLGWLGVAALRGAGVQARRGWWVMRVPALGRARCRASSG